LVGSPITTVNPVFEIALIIFGPIVIALFFYAMYRALKVRRVLSVELYRRQALWAGANGLYWAFLFLFTLSASLLYDSNPQLSTQIVAVNIVELGTLYVALILDFLWIDSSVNAARRSDPLVRDILSWRHLRIILWFAIFIGIVVSFTFYALPIVNRLNGDPIMGVLSFWIVNSPVFYIVGLSSIVGLIISWSRAKDPILKRHLRWLFLYTIVLFTQGNLSLLIYAPLSQQLLLAVLAGVLLTVAILNGLALFKTARSLAPISHLPVGFKKSAPKGT
jgi:hypothetical protein